MTYPAHRSMFDIFEDPCDEPDLAADEIERLIEQELAAYEASCPAHVEAAREAARAANHRAHVTEWLSIDIPF